MENHSEEFKTYIITLEATNDLTNIFEFGIYKFGVLQAEKFIEELFSIFDNIKRDPYLSSTIKYKPNTRKATFKKHTILFGIENKRVVIYRVVKKQNVLY